MSELIAALNQLEKEKGIDKDVIMEAIENSLLAACKRDFGSADNVVVNMDRETGDIYVYAIKEVVDEVYDPALEISLGKAKAIDQNLNLGDTVRIEITPKDFGRIAAMHARSVIVQKIKEEERRVVYDHFYCKEKDIVTGVVQRYVGENVSVSLDDKTDALLMKSEQIRGEVFKPTERIKLYIVEVKETNRGPRILVLVVADADGRRRHGDIVLADTEEPADDGNHRQHGERIADRRLPERGLRCTAWAVHGQAQDLLARRPALCDLEEHEIGEHQHAREQPGHPIARQ